MAAVGGANIEICLLGRCRVMRDGVEIALPRSRKVRALLAYLAVSSTAVSRSRLCDLLWDVPNDPRGELRWCLSKLRSVLDDDGRSRVVTTGQSTVSLDLGGDRVDALELDTLAAQDIGSVSTERLTEVAALAIGEFLEGMIVDGAEMTAWLGARRQLHRAQRTTILAELVRRATPGSDESFARLGEWLRAAPFEMRAHQAMLDALVKSGRTHDAGAHVDATIRAFEEEGVDWTTLRDAWRSMKRATAQTANIELISAPAPTGIAAPPTQTRHGSVVVMPFVEASSASSQVAHGLTDDIITRLAKLRVLFVIARGTSYALRERGIEATEAARILGVEYVVSGTVKREGERMTVVVELAEARTGGIVWTDEIEGASGDTFSMLDSVVNRIVAGISEEIERTETKRAVLKAPTSLDAWELYHRGLWHMYKFTGPDNELATKFFLQALERDETFSRAHAGLSFTHFQNVFLDLKPDRDREMSLAFETAGRSVAADDRDPAAHWAMGRALWLAGDRGAIPELQRSVELSPNFALGHYTLGFVQGQSGDPGAAIRATDYSRQLSPFDPLQFGMLGTRSIAHMRMGERDAAAEWGVRAASRPNAHAHILAIAATNLALANRRDEARALVARIRQKLPSYTVEDFLRAFRFEAEAEKIIRAGAKLGDFA
jgi:TolB-like protein